MSTKLLRDVEAAKYLGLSASTLRQSRVNGSRENRMPPPPFVRLGRSIRYDIDDLNRWINANRVEPYISKNKKLPKPSRKG